MPNNLRVLMLVLLHNVWLCDARICGGDDAPKVDDCAGHVQCGTCTPEQCPTVTDTPWESCTSQTGSPGCMDTKDFDEHGKTFSACVQDEKNRCCFAYPEDDAPPCVDGWCPVTTNFYGNEIKGSNPTAGGATVSSDLIKTEKGCKLGCSRIAECQSYLFNGKCQWYDRDTEQRRGTQTLYMFNMHVQHFDAEAVNAGKSSVKDLKVDHAAFIEITKPTAGHCLRWYVDEVWLPAVVNGTLDEGESYIGAAFPSTQTDRWPHPEQWFGIGVPLPPAWLPVQVSWKGKPKPHALNASVGDDGPGYNTKCGKPQQALVVEGEGALGHVHISDDTKFKWYMPSDDGNGLFTKVGPDMMPLGVPHGGHDLVLAGGADGKSADPVRSTPKADVQLYFPDPDGQPWIFAAGFHDRCMVHNTDNKCSKGTVLVDEDRCELGWRLGTSDSDNRLQHTEDEFTCKVYKLTETSRELSSFSQTKDYAAEYCSSCQDRYGDYACIRDGSSLNIRDWCVATSTEDACKKLAQGTGQYCKPSCSLHCSAGQSDQDFTCEGKEKCDGCDVNNCDMDGTRGDPAHVWAPCCSETGDPWGCIDSNYSKSSNACVQDPNKKGKCCYATESIVTPPTIV